MIPLREQTASVCQIYSSLYSLRLNKAGAKCVEKVYLGSNCNITPNFSKFCEYLHCIEQIIKISYFINHMRFSKT